MAINVLTAAEGLDLINKLTLNAVHLNFIIFHQVAGFLPGVLNSATYLSIQL
jgi:hypothetical protein